jgi:hypothetical protein
MQTSAAIAGTLLSIDVAINGAQYTADFTNYLPNGVWVQDESPYRVAAVVDGNGQHLLNIQDNHGQTVDEFRLRAL